MSTTSVPYPCAAASTRADRSADALVMSISSGSATTGTPRTTLKDGVPSLTCVTSRGRDRGSGSRRTRFLLAGRPGPGPFRGSWPGPGLPAVLYVQVQQLKDPPCRGAERADDDRAAARHR